MEANTLRCYYGSQRVLKVIDGWYRPSRKPAGEAQLVVCVLLKNKRKVVTRASNITGVGLMEMWAAFNNARRKCLESESTSDESAAEDGGEEDKVPAGEDMKMPEVQVVLDRLQTPPAIQGTSRSSSSSSTTTQKAKKVLAKVAKQVEKRKRDVKEEEEDEEEEEDDDGNSSEASNGSTRPTSSPLPRTPGGSPAEVDKSNWLKCTATDCGKLFKTAGGLKNHLKNVHDEAKITCEFCKATVGYSNVASHKKKCLKNPANKSSK